MNSNQYQLSLYGKFVVYSLLIDILWVPIRIGWYWFWERYNEDERCQNISFWRWFCEAFYALIWDCAIVGLAIILYPITLIFFACFGVGCGVAYVYQNFGRWYKAAADFWTWKPKPLRNEHLALDGSSGTESFFMHVIFYLNTTAAVRETIHGDLAIALFLWGISVFLLLIPMCFNPVGRRRLVRGFYGCKNLFRFVCRRVDAFFTHIEPSYVKQESAAAPNENESFTSSSSSSNYF